MQCLLYLRVLQIERKIRADLCDGIIPGAFDQQRVELPHDLRDAVAEVEWELVFQYAGCHLWLKRPERVRGPSILLAQVPTHPTRHCHGDVVDLGRHILTSWRDRRSRCSTLLRLFKLVVHLVFVVRIVVRIVRRFRHLRLRWLRSIKRLWDQYQVGGHGVDVARGIFGEAEHAPCFVARHQAGCPLVDRPLAQRVLVLSHRGDLAQIVGDLEPHRLCECCINLLAPRGPERGECLLRVRLPRFGVVRVGRSVQPSANARNDWRDAERCRNVRLGYAHQCFKRHLAHIEREPLQRDTLLQDGHAPTLIAAVALAPLLLHARHRFVREKRTRRRGEHHARGCVVLEQRTNVADRFVARVHVGCHRGEWWECLPGLLEIDGGPTQVNDVLHGNGVEPGGAVVILVAFDPHRRVRIGVRDRDHLTSVVRPEFDRLSASIAHDVQIRIATDRRVHRGDLHQLTLAHHAVGAAQEPCQLTLIDHLALRGVETQRRLGHIKREHRHTREDRCVALVSVAAQRSPRGFENRRVHPPWHNR